MSQDVQPKPLPPTSSIGRVAIYATVLFAVFLLGFIPMWIKARGCASSLVEVEQRLGRARMENDLSSAAIYARRGEYEPARQSASQFFTALRAEADRGTFTQAQRDGMQPLFTQRDDIITLLARNDPASADRLSDVYASYRKLMSS